MRLFATQGSPVVDAGVDPAQQVGEAIEGMAEGFFEALPGIGLALVVFVLFLVLAKATRGPIERRLTAHKTKSFGKVFGALIYAGIVILGLFFAIPLAVPSIELAAMIGGLGLLGVAAGFAFGDILSNLLSGVLLLIRDPFRSGDQIEVDGVQGTVLLITIRETQIKTFDGRIVYVPNADVYANAIEVQTAEPLVRTSLIVGVDYDADLGLARETALRVLGEIQDIAADPEPQAYYTEFGASSVDLDLRYWTSSRQADIRRVRDEVVERIKVAYDTAGIGIPFSIVTLDAGGGFEQAMVRAVRGEATPRGDASGNGARTRAGLDDLRALTREELYERAQRADIPGRSQMSKDELVEALRGS